MNMAVKSAKAAGRIAGSVTFMSFCLAGRYKEAVGDPVAHPSLLLRLTLEDYRDQKEILPAMRKRMSDCTYFD